MFLASSSDGAVSLPASVSLLFGPESMFERAVMSMAYWLEGIGGVWMSMQQEWRWSGAEPWLG